MIDRPDTWLQRLGHALAPADRSEMLAWCRSLQLEAPVALTVPRNAADCEHWLQKGIPHRPTWALLEQTRQALWHKVAKDYGALRARGHITLAIEPLQKALQQFAPLLKDYDASVSETFAPTLIREALWAAEDGVLARLAQARPDHPFRLRMNLFEAGRWPIGLFSSEQNQAPDAIIY